MAVAPEHLEAQYNLGNLHRQAAEFEAALSCYDAVSRWLRAECLMPDPGLAASSRTGSRPMPLLMAEVVCVTACAGATRTCSSTVRHRVPRMVSRC